MTIRIPDRAIFHIHKSFLPAAMVAVAVATSAFGPRAASASEVPSSAELYKMFLELKEENRALRAQVKRLEEKNEEKNARQDEAIAEAGAGPAAERRVASHPAPAPRRHRPARSSGPGFEAGVDVMYMQFYARQGAGGSASNNDDYFPDMGHDTTYRAWAEVNNGKGLGLRGRYFDYSDSAFFLGLDREQSIRSADLEVTFETDIADFDIKPFIGARWQEVNLHGSDFGEPNPYEFEGYGLTTGIDFTRQIYGPISIYAGGRYSLIFGDTTFGSVSNSELEDTLMSAVELRAGLQWQREFANGAGIDVRLGWEQHFYGTDTYFPFAIDPETLGDVGLGGPVFSAAFKF